MTFTIDSYIKILLLSKSMRVHALLSPNPLTGSFQLDAFLLDVCQIDAAV